jgi:hypothetical protein
MAIVAQSGATIRSAPRPAVVGRSALLMPMLTLK